jgi:polysaccharide pyruvyl transferase WcaK-like protein
VTGRNLGVFEATRRMFRKCAGLSLRDPVSYEFVKRNIPNVNCIYLPDSLFSWFKVIDKFGIDLPKCGDFIIPHPEKPLYWGKLDFSKPYICIGGSSLSGWNPKRAIESYTTLVEKVRELGYAVYLTENDGRDSFLEEIANRCNVGIVPVWTPILMCGAVLANAKLFISGRYHPTILASLGGTPCVFLASASHKMLSLQEVLEYEDIREFSAFPSDDEIEEIYVRSKDLLNCGERLREKVKAAAKRRCEETRQMTKFIKDNL